MADADFWRKREKDFRDLAKEQRREVPDPRDERRLRAYGDYTAGQAHGIGCWRLNDALSAAFRARFEETATRAGTALSPPRRVSPLHFWLHCLFQHVLELEVLRHDRGHLAVGDADHGGIIRDVCEVSATCCSRLAKEALERELETGTERSERESGNKVTDVSSPSVMRRRQTMGAIENIRILARQMLAEGATHREVCERLKNKDRPPRSEWRHLPWDKAYMDKRYRGSVCKWLSRNCRP